MRPKFLILFITICYQQAVAQPCAVAEYTDKDGLPSGVYTYAYQDRAGYLWVGTYANGAVRYDGRKWTTYSIKEGLESNKIDLCWEDKQGRTRFDHGQYGMTILNTDGSPRPIESSDARKKEHERNAVTPGGEVFYFNHDTRLISHFNAGTGRQEPTGLPWPDDSTMESSNTFIPNDHNLEGAFFLPQPQPGKSPTFFRFSNGQWHRVNDQLPLPHPHFVWVLDAPLIADLKKVYYQRKGQWEEIIPPAIVQLGRKPTASAVTEIQYVHVDYFQQKVYIIWKLLGPHFAKTRYLLAEYDSRMQLINSCIFATYHLPAQVMKDRAGTYWICSQTALLRVFPYIKTVPIDAPFMLPQVWGIAQAKDGQMWFSSYGKGLARFDGLDVHPQPAFLQPFTNYDNGTLSEAGTGNMYFNIEDPANAGILSFDGQKKWQRFNKGTLSSYMAYGKKGQLFRSTFKKGLWVLPSGADITNDDAWQKIDTSKGLPYFYNLQFGLEDSKGRYWMGQDKAGLACLDPNSGKVWKWLKSDTDKKNYGVMSMAEDKHGNLWFGTDRGLRFLSLPENMDAQFDVTTQLRPVGLDYTGESLVSVCHFYDDNTLIVGNSKGFFLLDLPAFYQNNIRIRSFTPATGHFLGGIIQSGFCMDHNRKVWLACAGGVTYFDPSILPADTARLPALIDSIRAGNNTFSNFSAQISLASGQQEVQIFFHVPPNLMLFDNVGFEYQLEGTGTDTAWLRLLPGAEFVKLLSLKAGNYRFALRAVKEGQSGKIAVIEFKILPFLWERPSFWSVILGIIVIVGIFWRRRELKISEQNLLIAERDLQLEKSRYETDRISKEKDKMQAQTIVSQLNPHFLNNVFHWLLIRMENDLPAVRVASRLSDNIGMVFRNTRDKKGHHALKDEMKLVENYLFIQKSRFGEKLDYELPPPNVLERLGEIEVPLMVIQIHVENGVEHGIRNNPTGAGRVSIWLREQGPYVIITIEDDGAGRAAAKRMGSKGTEHGTGMLEQLQQIYNRKNELPLEHYYEDDIFLDTKERVYGTRVVVRIPKDYKFEI